MRKKFQKLADERQAIGIVARDEVRNAAGRVVRRGAAQLFLRDVFVHDGLDDIRPGHKHAARSFDHDNEVRDGWRIDRAPGAGAHDGGNLRHHARGQRVAQENVGVASERSDAFLDARAAGIVQADDRRADLHGQVHDLRNLGRVRLAQRAAEHGEVLRESVCRASVDSSIAGQNAVAGHALLREPEFLGAVDHQFVGLFERPFVKEQLQPLARGNFALGGLPGAPLLAAAELGLGVSAAQLVESLLVRHR